MQYVLAWATKGIGVGMRLCQEISVDVQHVDEDSMIGSQLKLTLGVSSSVQNMSATTIANNQPHGKKMFIVKTNSLI